jgi:hypothetical protein
VLLNPIIRAQIATLIIATSIVQFANGFFGTLISLRVALEDFDATIASLVLSSYFAGFTIGASFWADHRAIRTYTCLCRLR